MKNPEASGMEPLSRANSLTTLVAPQNRCLAAAGQIDITPPIGIYHRMWGAAKHDRAASIHRPLLATMLWIVPRDGDRSVSAVIISLDHCILDAEDLSLIQASVATSLQLTPEQVIVCLSHTHAAGLMSRTRSRLPGGDLIGPYLDELAHQLGDLASSIANRLVDATIVYGLGRCDLAAERDYWDSNQGRYVCGFNPTGIADDQVTVAKVTDEAGKCLATIVNYACHPTTLAWDNQAISPDYVGAMREIVESYTKAPCLFLQGTSGDLGPREGFVGDTEVADRNGRKLGFAALAALETLPSAGVSYDYAGAVVSGTHIGTWKYNTASGDALRQSERWQQIEVIAELPYRPDLPSLEETRQEFSRWNALEVRLRLKVTSLDEPTVEPWPNKWSAGLEASNFATRRMFSSKDAHAALWQCALAVCPWRALSSASKPHYGHRFPNEIWIVATICNGWQPGYVPPTSKYGLEFIKSRSPSLPLAVQRL